MFDVECGIIITFKGMIQSLLNMMFMVFKSPHITTHQSNISVQLKKQLHNTHILCIVLLSHTSHPTYCRRQACSIEMNLKPQQNAMCHFPISYNIYNIPCVTSKTYHRTCLLLAILSISDAFFITV